VNLAILPAWHGTVQQGSKADVENDLSDAAIPDVDLRAATGRVVAAREMQRPHCSVLARDRPES
jgi:hypothetical protein